MALNGCSTALRLYRPYPLEKPYELIKTQPKISILTPDSLAKTMARYEPYIFRLKSVDYLGVEYELQNEYGNLQYLIKKELSIRPENYPSLIRDGGRVEVKEFILISEDHCSSNLVRVKMRAEIQIGKTAVIPFEYEDEIKSHVTDCFALGSTITIIPLIWYAPYVGFRGNREDQLNQLGRNALESFFSVLETKSGYVKASASETIKAPIILKETPPDPKLKQIMEDL
ncbi:MAG: hypothetical protein SH817_08975 [Leptospira sp.]|nr:hypothetical protein [Leptospira sp.]